MSASTEREREAELERLREHLASKRSLWVPQVAPNARYKPREGCWRLGSIGGEAGESLRICEDAERRTHQDFNGGVWEGDDLQLIRDMRGLDFLDAVREAAHLVGFELRHYGKREDGAKASDGARRIVATYDYVDPEADLLFQVVRFEPKDFRQRRPNGQGDWIWNLDGVRIVPYRLPDIEAAIEHEHTVYIVEGEKDADNLRAIGFTATCNPMGAGKWRSNFAELFQGADIVIIPDNDQAGRKHAEQVAANLAPAAKRVRCLELSGLAEKGDVTDWLSVGGTASKLLALGDAAPEWSGSTDALPPSIETLSAAHWIARQITEPDRLLGSWLTTDSRVMLVAPTGLGKTNLAMAAAFAMASGTSFLHWSCPRRSRVLYIDGEMSKRLVRARIADAARRCGQVPDSIFILSRDDIEDLPPLNSADGQTFMDSIISAIGRVDFVFFDNVQSLLTGDMKEEESWADTLPWIKTLTKRHVGQLWVHHTGIDEARAYGTSTRLWQLDTVVLLERIDRPDTDIAFNLVFKKARERTPANRADFEPAAVTLINDRWEVETAAIIRPGKPPSPKGRAFHSALLDALAKYGKPRTESVNKPSVSLDEWKAECVRKGLLDATKPDSQRALLSKYRLELVASGGAACNGEVTWNTTVSR